MSFQRIRSGSLRVNLVFHCDIMIIKKIIARWIVLENNAIALLEEKFLIWSKVPYLPRNAPKDEE